MFEQIKLVNHIRTTVHDHPQLSLKFRLANRISFDILTGVFAKLKRGYVKRCSVALSL